MGGSGSKKNRVVPGKNLLSEPPPCPAQQQQPPSAEEEGRSEGEERAAPLSIGHDGWVPVPDPIESKDSESEQEISEPAPPPGAHVLGATSSRIRLPPIQQPQQQAINPQINDGDKKFSAFLSHAKADAAEACFVQLELEDRQKKLGPTMPIIRGSVLKNLPHVRTSQVLVLLQTKDVLTRPLCLLELTTALDAGVPIVGVNLVGKGYDLREAVKFLTHLDTELDKATPDGSKLLESYGVNMKDAARKLSNAVPKVISIELNTSASRNGYGVRGKASRRLIRCLEQWSRIGEEREVRRTLWLHPTTRTCATDASSWAGGGLDNARPLDQQPLGRAMGVPMMHIWNEEERKLHITAKELKAFRQYLGLHAASFRNCGLLAWQDNQGVVGIMKKLAVKSKDPTTQLAMEADLEAIMDLLDKWDIHLKMRYIESARNPADYFTNPPAHLF
eukprot:COSAG05_NODE_3402_length_2085_cov_1.749245_1_plen_447_part_00